MQYLLMAMEDEAAFEAREDAGARRGVLAGLEAYLQALTEAGVLAGAGGLEPPATATTVRRASTVERAGRAGRAVRRHQGAARRVLRHRGRGPGRGAGAGRGGARRWTAGRARCARSCRRGRDRLADGAGRGRGRGHAAVEDVARASYGRLVAYLASGAGTSPPPRTRSRTRSSRPWRPGRTAACPTGRTAGCSPPPAGTSSTRARRRAPRPARSRSWPVLVDDGGRRRRGRAARIPDVRLQLMFACTHPAIDRGRPQPPHAADGPRPGRRPGRGGVPRARRRPWAQRLVRAKTKIRGPGCRSPCPRTTSCPRGSARCSTRSTPPTPRAGTTRPDGTPDGEPAAPDRPDLVAEAAAAWPGSSSSCCPGTPRPPACSPCCCTARPVGTPGARPTAPSCRSTAGHRAVVAHPHGGGRAAPGAGARRRAGRAVPADGRRAVRARPARGHREDRQPRRRAAVRRPRRT